MNTKTLLAASFALPLLLIACDRPDSSPSASAPSQEKQATAPSLPSPEDKMLQSAPPAAGIPPASSAPSASESPSSPSPSVNDSTKNQPNDARTAN